MRNNSEFSSHYISNQNLDEEYPYDSGQYIEADSNFVSQKQSISHEYNSNTNELPINDDNDFSTYHHQFDLLKRNPNRKHEKYSTKNYDDSKQPQRSSEFRRKTQAQKFSSDSFGANSRNRFQFNRSKKGNVMAQLDDIKDAQRKIKTQILLQDKKNKQMLQVWAKQIMDILKMSQKTSSYSRSSISDLKIKSLQQQNQRLRQYIQKQKDSRSKPGDLRLKPGAGDSVQKQRYQARIQQLMKEVKQTQKLVKNQERIIQDLSLQNQELQQSIFDYEQRIVGVDLQVDNRVAEILSRNDENKKNQQYLAKIQELNRQIQEISRKQQKNVQGIKQSYQKENQLKIKERQIMYRQRELEQKDEEIFKRFQEVQFQRQQLITKDRELLSFQEQLERRLGDLQIKENQIQLIKHQLNQNYKHFNNQIKYQHPTAIQKDTRSSHGTRGVHFQTPSRMKEYQKERSFTYSNVQPTKQKPYANPVQRRAQNISGQNKDHSPNRANQRSKPKHSPGLNKQPSAVSNLRTLTGKQPVSHQPNASSERQKFYNKTPARNNEYKIVDHQSFNNKKKLYSSNVASQPKGAQLYGIEEKLERLKQEIRKQIDSIN